jgi:RHS repeat-associated protein
MIGRQVTTGSTVTDSQHFVYDGKQIALALDDSGAVVDRYLWGPAVDMVLAQEDASHVVLWALGDNLNSVRDWVNNSGAVVDHANFDSYGNRVNTGSSPSNIAWTGKFHDSLTGFQYNQNRWYSPTVGRWMSEDPIGFAGNDQNVQRYADNRPISFTDPAGTEVVHVRHSEPVVVDRYAFHVTKDFYAYVAPGDKPPAGKLIPLTADEAQLVSFAHARANVEQLLVEVLNTVSNSGNGYYESFNYFWFDDHPDGNEPTGIGLCYLWQAAQRTKLPQSTQSMVVKEVEWKIDSFFSSMGVWKQHAAYRLEFPGVTFTETGKMAIAYLDDGNIGGSDHIFFQWNIPGTYGFESPGKLSDGTMAEHAGPPKAPYNPDVIIVPGYPLWRLP